ncbi:MAG: sensor histidine kinase [Solirubrobacteraceae bacterium]
MSLRARMGLAAGAAVALAVIAVAVSAYAGTRSQLRDQLDSQLNSLVQRIEGPGPGGPGTGYGHGAAAPGGFGGLFAPNVGGTVPLQGTGGTSDCDGGRGLDVGAGPGLGKASGLRLFVSRSGRPCSYGGGTKLPVPSQAGTIASSGHGQSYSDVTVSGQSFRMLVSGVPGGGAIEVALPLSDVNHTLSNELLLLGLIAAGGVALAALLGLFVARTALAPIARFTRQAESIAAHPARVEHERLEVSGNDELARLGRTFNTTLDALEESITAQRNLVADASHELRTPIAAVRANLQLMRDEALLTPEDRDALRTDMIEELDELTKLVGDVVELARGAKPPAEQGEVRVDLIVGDAIERARRRSPEHRFEQTLDITLVSGDGARIDRAVTNLLDNAAKYAPAGSVVDVALSNGVLSVADHGPGFHEEDLPFVFDRFHRAKDARAKPGSGLGLAIVRQAAEAHGGFVEANNAPGGGALMRISFGPVLELSAEGRATAEAARASAEAARA